MPWNIRAGQIIGLSRFEKQALVTDDEQKTGGNQVL
jgi:hypothetical protein